MYETGINGSKAAVIHELQKSNEPLSHAELTERIDFAAASISNATSQLDERDIITDTNKWTRHTKWRLTDRGTELDTEVDYNIHKYLNEAVYVLAVQVFLGFVFSFFVSPSLYRVVTPIQLGLIAAGTVLLPSFAYQFYRLFAQSHATIVVYAPDDEG